MNGQDAETFSDWVMMLTYRRYVDDNAIDHIVRDLPENMHNRYIVCLNREIAQDKSTLVHDIHDGMVVDTWYLLAASTEQKIKALNRMMDKKGV